MLNGQFPDCFPMDEDPVPVDGNPHPTDGDILHGNPDVAQGWQHDLQGAAQHVHEDFGLIVQQCRRRWQFLMLLKKTTQSGMLGLFRMMCKLKSLTLHRLIWTLMVLRSRSLSPLTCQVLLLSI
jgi:hypothetical protein